VKLPVCVISGTAPLKKKRKEFIIASLVIVVTVTIIIMAMALFLPKVIVSFVRESILGTVQVCDDWSSGISENVVFDETLSSHSTVDGRSLNIFVVIIINMGCSKSKRGHTGFTIVKVIVVVCNAKLWTNTSEFKN
jgi:hypothetical protein